jgi:hypothetical protein
VSSLIIIASLLTCYSEGEIYKCGPAITAHGSLDLKQEIEIYT